MQLYKNSILANKSADCLTKPVGRNKLDFCKNVLLGCKNVQSI